jgi:HEAT repeat protein
LIDRLCSLKVLWSRPGRRAVENELAALGPAAVPELLEALRPTLKRMLLTVATGRDPACHAAWALGRIGDPRAVEPLARIMRGGQSQIARAAADGLGLLGDRRAVPHLVRLLHGRRPDSLDERYFAAARALARLAGADEVDTLSRALYTISRSTTADSLEKLKTAAQRGIVACLRDIGDPRAVRCLLARGNTQFVAVSALVEFGPAAIPALVQVLGTEHGPDADKALLALIGMGEPALLALCEHVPGPPRPLASRCAIALCGLGVLELELIPPVILAVERSWSRRLALEALLRLAEEFNDPSLRTAIPILRRLLRGMWPATSGLTEAHPLVPLCREALALIERQTGDLQSLPVIASAPAPDAADLPVVSE